MADISSLVAETAKNAVRDGKIALNKEIDYSSLISGSNNRSFAGECISDILDKICRMYNLYLTDGGDKGRETAVAMLEMTMRLRSPYLRLMRRGLISYEKYINEMRRIEFAVCVEYGVLPVHSDHYLEKFGVEIEEIRFEDENTEH